MREIIITIALLLTSASFACGQNSISGRISDEAGNPLESASIVVSHSIINGTSTALKTQIGGISDLDGYYILPSVPNGKFLVQVIYLGYQVQTFQVDLGDQEGDIRKDIFLKREALDLEEVVVSAQAKGQLAAINQQLTSTALTNVVASDRIRQNPDANAAEAIGRLPGITVSRSGGEASDIIIRGMPSQYNHITLNGIELPSATGDSRAASLAGISQYSLQGVEVFKSITPDMDANAVAGAVNMKLKKAPDGFNSNLMIQGGFNAQNTDFSNYKIHANVSNRFFDNKLGFDLNISSERANRSTQKLDAGYDWESGIRPDGESVPLYNTFIGLANVERIVHRNSGTLVLDYKFSPKSSIEFSNFFTTNPHDGSVMSKTFLPMNGEVFYNVDQNIAGRTNMYSGTLLGTQIIGRIAIDYGGSYTTSNSLNEDRNVDVRSYQGFYNGALDQTERSLPLPDIINMANNEQSQENLRSYGLGGRSIVAPNFYKALNEQNEDQYETHVDISMPFQIGTSILVDLKIGGQYKYKNRNRDFDLVVWHSNVFQDFITGAKSTGDGINWLEGLEWVTLNENAAVSMENMVGGSIDNFLGREYVFGWYPDVDKINQIYDYWIPMVEYYRAQGQEVWEPLFGFEIAMGNILPRPSVANDYSFIQNYYAAYMMPSISIGNKFKIVPGFRYEKVDADMKSWYVERRLNENMEIPGYETAAKRENAYFLPMVHFKYKALKRLQFQGSYTQTLNRPLFNTIVPYVYVNNADKPYTHESGNSQLRPELWTNYDLNATLHGGKIGLFSINGFYKLVEDKIWNRTWTRLAEDEPIAPFSETDEVDVIGFYNHEYDVTVMGFEAEWQTNFWYLPKPFSYFTLTLNYTYINNETKYPWEEVVMMPVDTTSTGRIIYEKVRLDSVYAGPMINQPKHLANASLGFSYKGFDTWLSFQYIGDIPISLSGAVEKHVYKIAFVRWDLQSRLELPVKGLELLLSISNINNIQEEQYMKGDTRPLHIESYGLTVDFGVRYTLR
jgi:TonB-dependent receptor